MINNLYNIILSTQIASLNKTYSQFNSGDKFCSINFPKICLGIFQHNSTQ